MQASTPNITPGWYILRRSDSAELALRVEKHEDGSLWASIGGLRHYTLPLNFWVASGMLIPMVEWPIRPEGTPV